MARLFFGVLIGSINATHIWGMDVDILRFIVPVSSAIESGNVSQLRSVLQRVSNYYGQEGVILERLLGAKGITPAIRTQMMAALLQQPNFNSNTQISSSPALIYIVHYGKSIYALTDTEIRSLTLLLLNDNRYDLSFCVFDTQLHYLLNSFLQFRYQGTDCVDTIAWAQLPDPHVADSRGNTLLHTVVRVMCLWKEDNDVAAQARLAIVQKLLQNPKLDINRRDVADNTALRAAVGALMLHGSDVGPNNEVIGALLGHPNIDPESAQGILDRVIDRRISAGDLAGAIRFAQLVPVRCITNTTKWLLIHAHKGENLYGRHMPTYQERQALGNLFARWNLGNLEQQQILDTPGTVSDYQSYSVRWARFWQNYSAETICVAAALCVCAVALGQYLRTSDNQKTEKTDEPTEQDSQSVPTIEQNPISV